MQLKEQISGIIRNMINEAQEKLDQSKINLADVELNFKRSDTYYQDRQEAKLACRTYEAKIDLLEELDVVIEEIPEPKPAVA